MAANTVVKVWLSHDGYRDPDDNLSMLVGGAQARKVEASNSSIKVAGFVFGDTKDGGQYYMLHPTGKAPKAFGNDSRYNDKAGNKVAAGNYAFYKEYGKEALKDFSAKWSQYDLLAQDKGGQRAWNFDSKSKSAITSAAAALADDIREAIGKGGSAKAPAEVVVYSAGGGANVAAEAIGYLYNQGVSTAAIKAHFAVVQHGRSNWANAYETDARELTRDFTIAISNQNYARYTNGMSGPDLKHAVAKGKADGSGFGADFAKALAVATGVTKAAGLGSGVTFKTTTDASDAGSHAFAVDKGRLLAAWDDRMVKGDDLPGGDNWAYRISGDSGARMRVVYNAFDKNKVAQLLDDDFAFASAPKSSGPKAAAAAAAETAVQAQDKDAGGAKAGAGEKLAGTFKAPFATKAAVKVDGAKLYGVGADGKKAGIAIEKGKIGVKGTGDGNTVDHHGKGSEKINIDFGAAVEAITLKLAGLSAKGGAREAAHLTAYDADGKVLDTFDLMHNGKSTVHFDEGVRYATLEAADWITHGHAPGGEPDFALVSLGMDYV